jgi:outer membrane protein TolC
MLSKSRVRVDPRPSASAQREDFDMQSSGPILASVLLAVCAAVPTSARAQALGLAEAVQQALGSSVELEAARASLDASRKNVRLSRSALLPQIGVGAQGQILDDDRADGSRGNATQKSATVYATAVQELYDETSWAAYGTQKHLLASQEQSFAATRLDLAVQAADAFLQLEQAREILRIQQQNRDVTLRNIETARARVAAGYSGERDVLRWQTQLAGNETAVIQAEAQSLLALFELNRLRNRAREDPADVVRSELETYGFVFKRAPLAEAITTEEGALRLRDFMVREGLARSPVLASIDAQIDAESRQLTARKRAFWLPSARLGAGINHLAAEQRADGQTTDINETEWGVRAALDFPLYEGGAKFSGLSQTRLTVSSLRKSRRAEAQAVEQSIRSAFALATSSYLALGYARDAVESSRKNYELVNDSYVAGVSSILDLLDAQTELLSATIGATQARYGFLRDLVSAEQAISMLVFLESPEEEAALLDRLEASMRDSG